MIRKCAIPFRESDAPAFILLRGQTFLQPAKFVFPRGAVLVLLGQFGAVRDAGGANRLGAQEERLRTESRRSNPVVVMVVRQDEGRHRPSEQGFCCGAQFAPAGKRAHRIDDQRPVAEVDDPGVRKRASARLVDACKDSVDKRNKIEVPCRRQGTARHGGEPPRLWKSRVYRLSGLRECVSSERATWRSSLPHLLAPRRAHCQATSASRTGQRQGQPPRPDQENGRHQACHSPWPSHGRPLPRRTAAHRELRTEQPRI